MVTPSVQITTDLNNNCGGATTSLTTMQYIVYRLIYWMAQSVSGSGAAVITRSSNGSSVNDTDLITGVGAGAIVFGASGAARSWAAMTMPAGYGNVFGGGRLYMLVVAEDATPATPISIRVSIAPNQFTGGTTTTLPTAAGSASFTFNLRSNTTVGAFRADFWKDATGNVIYQGKLVVESNSQAGWMLLDPVASTQTNRFTFLSTGAAVSSITSWLPYISSATTMGFNAGSLVSVATGLTALTNGIDNTARMPAFPFSITVNTATLSGGRLVGTFPDYLTIGGSAASTFNYGDPAETGTMRYRTMGCFMIPCPIGTVLE